MLYLKAFHIIFIVTWFAGMFYIVRLFIYQTEACEKPQQEQDILVPQLQLMSRRLWYGITFPSAMLTLVLGPMVMWRAFYLEDFGAHTWLHIKLVLVVLLYLYFFSLHRIFLQLQRGVYKRSARFLRVWNEVATVFLVAIVILATVKNSTSWLWGLLGLVLFVAVLITAIRIYQKIREKK